MVYLNCPLSIAFVIFGLFFMAGDPVFAASKEEIHIAIISDGLSENKKNNINELKYEIKQLLNNDYRIIFHSGEEYDGRWSLQRIAKAFAQAQQDDNVFAVIAYGPLASHIAASFPALNKPTIATLFIDSDLQSVPRDGDRSGKRNLNYIQHTRTFLEDIKRFSEIQPFKRLAIVGGESIQQLETFNQLFATAKTRLQQEQIELKFIPVASDVQPAITQIKAQIGSQDAIYMLPIDRLTSLQIQQLANAMIDAQIPAYAMLNGDAVAQGFLASVGLDGADKRSRRRIALNLHDILNGEAAENLNVFLKLDHQLIVNQETANQLGIGLTWSTLQKAEVINVSQVAQKSWTFKSVVDEAVKQNLTLKTEEKSLQANKADYDLALAKRLPQISVDMQQTWIDEDRAKFSNGNSAERDLSASLTVKQILYNEAAWSNITVQKQLHEARTADLKTSELNIIEDATLAYLNVLRAQSLIDIESKNLQLTMANLSRAERRVEAGAARKSEIYRWQSQQASNNSSLVDAEARLKNAKLQLNQLLNRPLSEAMATETIDKDHPVFDFNRTVTSRYVTGPVALQQFTLASERFGIDNAPELLNLKLLIAAQERLLKARKRQYFVPDVSLQASFKEHIDKNGEGDEYPSNMEINDSDASLALVVSLPLYQGGERSGEIKQSQQTIEQFRLQLANTRNLVRQRVRTAINRITSSYPGIQFSENGLRAAQQNYTIVRESYERGTVSIVDFLDAQNQVFSAETSYINAIYDYLEDQMLYQRAIGYFFDFGDSSAIKSILNY